MSHLSHLPEALQQPLFQPSTDAGEIEAALLDLKEAAIEATRRGDTAFYADYLSDDSIAITPFGIFDKQQILAGMKSGRSFRSSKVEDTRAWALGEDAGLVTYRATFEMGDAIAAQFFVSTLYRRFREGWKGVFYQQTPLPVRNA